MKQALVAFCLVPLLGGCITIGKTIFRKTQRPVVKPTTTSATPQVPTASHFEGR